MRMFRNITKCEGKKKAEKIIMNYLRYKKTKCMTRLFDEQLVFLLF